MEDTWRARAPDFELVRDAAGEDPAEDHTITLHAAAVKLPALALEAGAASGVRVRVSQTTS